jgi:hypothetical protein
MGRLARRLAQGRAHDARHYLAAQGGKTRGTGLVAQKTIHAFVHESLLPAPDAGLADPRLESDLIRPNAIGGETHDARQTCFCGVFRPAAIDRRRVRSTGLNSISIHLRIRQTRIIARRLESIMGLFSPISSTLMFAVSR